MSLVVIFNDVCIVHLMLVCFDDVTCLSSLMLLLVVVVLLQKVFVLLF